jgi:hypothetical protein
VPFTDRTAGFATTTPFALSTTQNWQSGALYSTLKVITHPLFSLWQKTEVTVPFAVCLPAAARTAAILPS